MKSKITDQALSELAKSVIDTELAAIAELPARVDKQFIKICHMLLACKGRVVLTGIGKSGLIARKISATLSSTGTPSFFLHPGEASHGDLGMLTTQDMVIALSNSGETPEIITILPIIKRLGIPLFAMTGMSQSTLAQRANEHILLEIHREACPLGLAPTTSTTMALVMGDAIAVALMGARGFTRDDFAMSHPGGSLGKRLLLLVSDIMHTGSRIPAVREDARLSDVLVEMTQKELGMTAVITDENIVLGIFTDGDLRRVLANQTENLMNQPVHQLMTRNCTTVEASQLAAEAMQLMQSCKINALLVVDDENRLLGALNMHDLIRAGIV